MAKGGTIPVTVITSIEREFAVVALTDDMETGAPVRQIFRRFYDNGDFTGLHLAMDLAERKTAYEYQEYETVWFVEDVTGEGADRA